MIVSVCFFSAFSLERIGREEREGREWEEGHRSCMIWWGLELTE